MYSFSEMADSVALHDRIPDEGSWSELFLEGGEVDETNTSDLEIAPEVRERFAGDYRHRASG